jgi:hypothetical protein
MKLKKLNTPKWTLSRIPLSVLVENDYDPIPDAKYRQRVAGHVVAEDPTGAKFISGGYEMAKQVANIFEVYTGEKLDNRTILDWGVGCARVARHFKNTSSKVLGIDIDPINIKWNSLNIVGLDFLEVEPNENFTYKSKFDLVYSFSVTSHLALRDSLFWLENLAKSCQGLMIISTHGFRHAFEFDWTDDKANVLNWLQKGIVGGGNNPDIADIAPKDYYGDYSLTYSHIYENWSKVVEIVDIIPFGLGSHDAVICKART